MYRAYDTVTEWMGRARTGAAAAERDARAHNFGCRRQGGYGSAIVVREDPDCSGRCVDLDGAEVWPPHGRSCGTVRWPAPQSATESPDLRAGIARHEARVAPLLGRRVRATTLGRRPSVVEGMYSDGDVAPCQPIVAADDGRRYRVDIDTAEVLS